MPFCQYKSAHLLIGNAGIQGTAQFTMSTFLLETKVLVPSSYRNDEEDTARKCIAYGCDDKAELTGFPEWIVLRVLKKAPVLLLLIGLESGQEVRNVVKF